MKLDQVIKDLQDIWREQGNMDVFICTDGVIDSVHAYDVHSVDEKGPVAVIIVGDQA